MDTEILELRDLSNAEILNGIREDASFDYQTRIPLADQSNIATVVQSLLNYRPSWNEFSNGFVNRIGAIYARSALWTNPLGVFKKGLMTFGDTVEEYMSDILEAHSYDPDRNYMEQTLFGQERPAIEVNYHKVNRQDFYKFTVNEKILRRAFLNDQGLATLIAQIMEAPLKSDQWDEYLIMANLLKQNEANGGFYKIQVPEFAGINTSSDDAKIALAKIRSMAYRLPILSRQFNAAHLPMAAKAEDLVLIGTPDFLASIDVFALAPLFHLEKAEQVFERTIALPAEHFGVSGTQGILTTKDFWMVFDTLIENRNQPNPAGLYENYFLHHHGIYSLSRFVPAIMFTSDSGTVQINSKAFAVSSVAAPVATDSDGVTQTTVQRGEIYSLSSATVTDPAGIDVAVQYTMTGNLSSHTYITQHGVLYVAGNETATSLAITALSVSTDPTNPRLDPVASTATTLTVAGTVKTAWPAGVTAVLKGITIAGVPVAGIVPATLTYALTLPAGTVVNKGKVLVDTVGDPDVTTTVVAGAPGYTVTVKVDNGAGAAKVYVVTVTVP